MYAAIVGNAAVGKAVVGNTVEYGGSDMNYDVTVEIGVASSVGTKGFGSPLIVNIGAKKDYAEFSSISELSGAYENTTAVYKMAAKIWGQNHKPQTIAVISDTAENIVAAVNKVAAKDWRQMVITKDDEATDLSAVASALDAFAAVSEKTLFFSVKTTAELAAAPSGKNTYVIVHDDDFAVGAVVGNAAGSNAGSINYKNMLISGVKPMSFGTDELSAIEKANAATILEKAGDIVTSGGKSRSGQYMDIVDIVDWVSQNMRYKIQKVLNTNDKVGYDNTGISLFEAAMIDVMNTGYNYGMIAQNDDGSKAYTVSCTPRSETSVDNRSKRHYPYAAFEFDAKGAIDTVHVTGKIKM